MMSFFDGRVVLHRGNCLDILATLPENSIDACVCDPPYHLTSIVKRFGADNAAPAEHGKDGAYARASAGFMGKQWDGGDIAFQVATWEAVYRVLKPGAYIAAFASIRHAMKFLKPGGTLVSVLPASAWYDHKELDGRWTDLPVASFAESGTNIPTGYIRMRKPA